MASISLIFSQTARKQLLFAASCRRSCQPAAIAEEEAEACWTICGLVGSFLLGRALKSLLREKLQLFRLLSFFLFLFLSLFLYFFLSCFRYFSVPSRFLFFLPYGMEPGEAGRSQGEQKKLVLGFIL